jgi:hypothetical protein
VNRRWPNLFVIGAQKAGTTSVHMYLGQHPDICMSRVKEPHYFSDVRAVPAWRGDRVDFVDDAGRRMVHTIHDTHRYLDLFSHRSVEQVVGESSTSYLYDAAAPDRIAEASPDARIVALLREPAGRAFSHWTMFTRERMEGRPFERCLLDELADEQSVDWPFRYVGNGLYTDAVRRWQAAFPGRVLTLQLSNLQRDPAATMAAVFTFLAVDPSVAERLEYAPRNVDFRGRSPVIRRLERSQRAWWAARRFLPERVAHTAKERLTEPVPPAGTRPPEVPPPVAEVFARDAARLVEGEASLMF